MIGDVKRPKAMTRPFLQECVLQEGSTQALGTEASMMALGNGQIRSGTSLN